MPESAWLNIAGIGCQADKSIEAVQHFFHIFDKLNVIVQLAQASETSLTVSFTGSKRDTKVTLVKLPFLSYRLCQNLT